MTALFRLEGQTAHPSEYTRGPWRADAQHGGPPSALLTRLVESVTEPEQWIARMSVELLSPVPLRPLRCETATERVSRRVAIAVARLIDEDRVVARASARLLTTSDGPDPDVTSDRTRQLPGPETEARAPAWIVGANELTFHRDALRHRWEAGGFAQPGPAKCWHALECPVIEGEPITGHQRIMAIADLASGVSAVYCDASRYGMINADLDVVFVREPNGEWVRSEAVTRVGDDGTGVCTNLMSDEAGVVAAGSQTLLGRRF